MNPSEIISRKRDREPLTQDDIADFINGFAAGEIPDYQMSALAMAILLNGMSDEETAWLTQAMLASGASLSWDSGLPLVDKHSTGGVGDKVSLILAPLLACCGCRVPMISGRGLGPTGGTLDKLESIPGFRADLTMAEMQRIVDEVGCVICGASEELVPADRKLYALRDVTGTVPSIPLITASIMSKKLAEGLDALVLDVKAGSGAFMKTPDDARALAQSLVATGERMGLRTSAMITDMNQPLGRMIGNAVEVNEAVEALQGHGPRDLVEVTLALGGELLAMASLSPSREAGVLQLQTHLDSGAGMERFEAMVAAQGGDCRAPRAIAPASSITAKDSGYVSSIDVERLAWIVVEMGGGRTFKDDEVDHSVGLEVPVQIGDRVDVGQPLLNLFGNLQLSRKYSLDLQRAVQISQRSVPNAATILESGLGQRFE